MKDASVKPTDIPEGEGGNTHAPGSFRMRRVGEALGAALVLFLVSAAANTLMFGYASRWRTEFVHDQLRSHVLHAARILDARVHHALASPAQTGSADHVAQLSLLQSVRDTFPHISRLFSVRVNREGKAHIILETPPDAFATQPRLPIGREVSKKNTLPAIARMQAVANTEASISYENEGTIGVAAALPRVSDASRDFVVAHIGADTLALSAAGLQSAFHLALLVSLILSLAGGLVVYFLRVREFRARQMRPADKEFFRKITAVLPGMLYQARVSPHGRISIAYVSEAARWVFEKEPRELVDDPRSIIRRLHPDDRRRIIEGVVERARCPGEWREEFRVVLPAAGERWCLGISHVERLEGGSTLWNGFLTDVTWRKHAEDALRKSEAGFKIAQQVAGMGSWELEIVNAADLDANKLHWSEETYHVFGLDARSTPASSALFFRHVPPDDHAAIREAMARAISRQGRYSIDHRIIRADGEIRHVREDALVLCNERTGAPAFMLGTIHDITEQKSREEATRLNEQRLNLAIQAGQIGTWDFDVSTKRVFWNDVLFRMKGLDPAAYDPNHQSNLLLVHPDDRERVAREFENCLRSDRRFYELESRTVLPNGEVRHTKSNAIIIRDAEGRATRVVGVEIDITAEKRAIEAALAADRAKSEFLAMMSHEIRTPMNGVLGFTNLLKDSTLSREQRQFVETIESSGQHLLHLINDILDLSKIESGRIQIRPAPLALRPFLDEIITLLRPRAEEKNLDYTWRIEPGVPDAIATDRTRLGQILTNLLGNAVKFTDHGGVHLHVSAHRLDHDDAQRILSFTVSDTGPGIPTDVHSRIFEPFYQTDLTSARRHGGTGLGLSISRRLARLLGGDLTVISTPGTGSQFTATIRVTTIRPGALPDRQPLEPVSIDGFAGKRALVVDDDAVGRRLCRLQLEKLGFETTTAKNGSQAVDLCLSGNFDVVLMDVQMPGMDGFDATRNIRRSEKNRTCIIALTANAMPDDRDRCLDAGMDDYLAKPIRADQLTATLHRWI